MQQPKYLKAKSRLSFKRKRQIAIGIILLLCSAVIIAMASAGPTMEERDITPIVFIAPLGVYLICTKNILI